MGDLEICVKTTCTIREALSTNITILEFLPGHLDNKLCSGEGVSFQGFQSPYTGRDAPRLLHWLDSRRNRNCCSCPAYFCTYAMLRRNMGHGRLRNSCNNGTMTNPISHNMNLTSKQVPTLPLTALSIVLAREGLGRDMWTISFDNITNILHVCLQRYLLSLQA
jgi:hypothetical protein